MSTDNGTETTNKQTSPIGLRYWIIIPFFILTTIVLLILAGSTLIRGRMPLDLLLVTFFAFMAVILLGLLITRQIVERINSITRAAEEVAHGNFDVRLYDNKQDEIGRLARSFNQMAHYLEDLHHSRDLLSRTMSPAVRHSLLERGLDFRGITQEVSIMFIDIRGFTRIIERHNTEQVVFFLNDYYTSIANQVHMGGGIIGKYGGDSILAFFGAPEPQPPMQSTTQALLTALALQGTIEQLSERWTLLGLPPIRVGVGLSIGPVVAGPIGSENQFEYTVIGDAVNLASRLQSLTRNVEGYSIMLAAEIYHNLDNKFKEQIQLMTIADYNRLTDRTKARKPVIFVDLGEVIVKGKRGPVHVYGIPDFDPQLEDGP